MRPWPHITQGMGIGEGDRIWSSMSIDADMAQQLNPQTRDLGFGVLLDPIH